MKCECDSKIEDGNAAAYEHRTECLIIVAGGMGKTKQDGAAQDANSNAGGGPYPFIIDCILYKEADSKHENRDTYFTDEIFADKFFKIRMSFKKRRFRFRRRWWWPVRRRCFG